MMMSGLHLNPKQKDPTNRAKDFLRVNAFSNLSLYIQTETKCKFAERISMENVIAPEVNDFLLFSNIFRSFHSWIESIFHNFARNLERTHELEYHFPQENSTAENVFPPSHMTKTNNTRQSVVLSLDFLQKMKSLVMKNEIL